jgi:hypothetical protein
MPPKRDKDNDDPFMEHHAKASAKQRRHVIRNKEVDDTLSAAEWRKVYEYYAQSGDPAKLSKLTNLSQEKIVHCIDVGVRRLGLPAIRQFATDQTEVTQRIIDLKLDPTKAVLPKPVYQELPEQHKDEMVDRAAKESIGAQLALAATMEIGTSFFEVIKKVKDRINLPPEEGGLELPEKLSLRYLTSLANTASTLTHTMSEAIRLNRLTQGEPEHNISVEIGYLLQKLPEEAVLRYAKEGQIPPQLRGRIEQNVIDVVPDDEDSND